MIRWRPHGAAVAAALTGAVAFGFVLTSALVAVLPQFRFESQFWAVLPLFAWAGALGVDGVAALARRLESLPGIGPWTTAEALQRSHGAADLVSVGDYHLAQYVGQVLTGRRTDDAGMLRLLAPWAGHRQRVVRMIGLSGERKQAFGPKLAPADHRAH